MKCESYSLELLFITPTLPLEPYANEDGPPYKQRTSTAASKIALG